MKILASLAFLMAFMDWSRSGPRPIGAGCPNAFFLAASDLQMAAVDNCKECREVERGKPAGTRIYQAFGYMVHRNGTDEWDYFPINTRMSCTSGGLQMRDPLTGRHSIFPRQSELSVLRQEWAVAPGEALPSDLRRFLNLGVARYVRNL